MIVIVTRADTWSYNGRNGFKTEVGDRLELKNIPSKFHRDCYRILNIESYCLISNNSFRLMHPLEQLAGAAE